MKKIKYIIAIALIFTCLIIPFSSIEAGENYKGWSQVDSRWASISLGSSYTMKNSGCIIVSMTKLVIQAGIKTTKNFDVIDMTKSLRKNGAISGCGDMCWDRIDGCVEGFEYAGELFAYGSYSSTGYNKKLLNYIKNGYHLILLVKGGNHWVAVDEEKSLKTGKIYIMDSAKADVTYNYNIKLASRYSSFSRVVAFKGGTTAFPKKSLSKAKVKGIVAKEYSGEKIKQEKLKVTLNGKRLKCGVDYTVFYSNNKEIGKATVKIKGIGKYKGCIVKQFKIKVYSGNTYTADGITYEVIKASTNGQGTVKLLGDGLNSIILSKYKIGDVIKIGNIDFTIKKISGKYELVDDEVAINTANINTTNEN